MPLHFELLQKMYKSIRKNNYEKVAEYFIIIQCNRWKTNLIQVLHVFTLSALAVAVNRKEMQLLNNSSLTCSTSQISLFFSVNEKDTKACK